MYTVSVFFNFALQKYICLVLLKYTICLYILFVTMSMYINTVHNYLILLVYGIDVYEVLQSKIICFICGTKIQYTLINSITPCTQMYLYLMIINYRCVHRHLLLLEIIEPNVCFQIQQ